MVNRLYEGSGSQVWLHLGIKTFHQRCKIKSSCYLNHLTSKWSNFRTVFALLHLQVINARFSPALGASDVRNRATVCSSGSVSAGFYFYSHCCHPLPCFVLLSLPDAISVLCSTDEESPYLFSLFEGRQRWIDIDGLRWRLGSVVFQLGTRPTFFHIFSSLRTEWDAAAVLMNISTKSLTVNLFFFTFVFPLVLITVLLTPLPSVLHKGWRIPNVSPFKGLAICEIH